MSETKSEVPTCTTTCRHYVVGYTEIVEKPEGGVEHTRYRPRCEHPSRPSGGLDVVKDEERADCPLRGVP